MSSAEGTEVRFSPGHDEFRIFEYARLDIGSNQVYVKSYSFTVAYDPWVDEDLRYLRKDFSEECLEDAKLLARWEERRDPRDILYNLNSRMYTEINRSIKNWESYYYRSENDYGGPEARGVVQDCLFLEWQIRYELHRWFEASKLSPPQAAYDIVEFAEGKSKPNGIRWTPMLRWAVDEYIRVFHPKSAEEVRKVRPIATAAVDKFYPGLADRWRRAKMIDALRGQIVNGVRSVLDGFNSPN
jgi:hypothetical protein